MFFTRVIHDQFKPPSLCCQVNRKGDQQTQIFVTLKTRVFFPYYRLQPSILQEVLRLECAKDVGWKTSEGVEGGVRTPGTPRISPHFQLLST